MLTLIKRKEIEKANTLAKRAEIVKSIEHINGLFQRLGSENKVNDITMNAYPELADLLTAKEGLMKQLNAVDVQLIEQEKVVYVATKFMNIAVSPFLPYYDYITITFHHYIYIVIAYLNSKIKSLKN